jgi:ParB-like chromosome segregation protein Spo0J
MAGAVMSKPKTQMIDLRDIVVQPNRMRQPRPEVVDELLAASIEAEGLLQPIVVRPHPPRGLASFWPLAGIVLRRSAS